jgi:hypothetical protein
MVEDSRAVLAPLGTGDELLSTDVRSVDEGMHQLGPQLICI